ncbi:MAG TPA: hypothetical protein VN613_10675 [Gemmatimonadaceae bacterium]|nr:hypothetical protein [Gemmatimonadaceae bacterium]
MNKLSRLVCVLAAASSAAGAQARKLRIVATDSTPIVYAYVTVEGGTGQITDEHGEVSLGAGKKKTVTVNARRIGYQPFFGKIDLPDTAATIVIALSRLTQTLGAVQITGQATHAAALQPFYDRWLLRQKGALSATFIGPEEIEFRHPNKVTNLLSGLNGVSWRNTERGDLIAYGNNGTCQMAVLVDGVRQCPNAGCKCDECGANAPEIMSATKPTFGRPVNPVSDENAVIIDHVVDAASVTAIEVYTRGANMPVSLQVSDNACGVIAIWTGSRKP